MAIIEQQTEFLSAHWHFSDSVLSFLNKCLVYILALVYFSQRQFMSFYLFHQETQNLKLNSSRILQERT